MKILIQGGRLINPATGLDQMGDLAVAAGRIVGLGAAPAGFVPSRVLDASGCMVMPGLVDLCARMGEPGREHEGMLDSEMTAAVAGGITSVVCPPDTDPVLDEPGLVTMLKSKAGLMHKARLFPLGALTRGLAGETLTEMVELTDAGCVGFGQAEHTIVNTQILQRALQYASSFGYTVWLRPHDVHLGKGVAASGPLATRLGLAGVPVLAETIALHTIFELMRSTGARVHVCRISSAAGVELLRQARASGLPVTADVSINSLLLTDADVGYFDSRARLVPPLRQQRDRDALRQALLDGSIDALVSDHTPVHPDAKVLPFAEAEAGATGLELLLSVAWQWGRDTGQTPVQALACVTSRSAAVLGHSLDTLQASLGQLVVGGAADVCVFDPAAPWVVDAHLCSQSKSTPLSGYELTGRVRATIANGNLAFERA
jgi:dihydroorotase